MYHHFDTASIGVLIGLCITAWGYWYNANEQRKLERYKIKTQAYAHFLAKIEDMIPETKITLTDNSKIKELNKALSTALIYAPSEVVLEMHKIAIKGKINRETIKEIQLTFHADINDLSKDISILDKGKFPFFPFQ